MCLSQDPQKENCAPTIGCRDDVVEAGLSRNTGRVGTRAKIEAALFREREKKGVWLTRRPQPKTFPKIVLQWMSFGSYHWLFVVFLDRGVGLPGVAPSVLLKS